MKRRSQDAKLGELILYVADKCAHDRYFGSTKLNKILFYSDFLAFKLLGEPITGTEYQRLEWGPAPKRLLPVLKSLEKAGSAVIKREMVIDHEQKRVVNLRAPDLSEFSGKQIALVDRVIDVLRDHTNTEVSELSHLNFGWQVARDGETIPYSTILLSKRAPTAAELEHGLKLAEELGL